MRARIHRGAHEIGGSCVEVESAAGDRIVLDVGAPLATAEGEEPVLPQVSGFVEAAPSLHAILITHGHQDHWGLVDRVLPEVPLYMGEAAHRILKEAAFWVSGLTREPAAFFHHRVPLHIGAFRVTPLLSDHSAYDAYSLLVEADGRRLFYTGDIRGHGRKFGIFEELVQKPPLGVDVLLTEGTNIGPEDLDSTPAVTESDIELTCAELFGAARGLVLALYSAQNIDRMVTLFRAAKRAGRTFVMTLYGASIAEATGNPNIPKPGWKEIRVFVPGWQQMRVKQAGAFERVEVVRPYRVYEEDLASDPSRWVVSFSISMAKRLEMAGCLLGAQAVWSMWPGYLKEERSEVLLEWLHARHIPLSIQHTSGHASIPDLQRLAAAMPEARVVPIHSLGGRLFDDVFDHVEHHPDGEWWDV